MKLINKKFQEIQLNDWWEEFFIQAKDDNLKKLFNGFLTGQPQFNENLNTLSEIQDKYFYAMREYEPLIALYLDAQTESARNKAMQELTEKYIVETPEERDITEIKAFAPKGKLIVRNSNKPLSEREQWRKQYKQDKPKYDYFFVLPFSKGWGTYDEKIGKMNGKRIYVKASYRKIKQSYKIFAYDFKRVMSGELSLRQSLSVGYGLPILCKIATMPLAFIKKRHMEKTNNFKNITRFC